MAWQLILKASNEAEAREAKPAIADIPAGSEVQINIDLPVWAPVGRLADLAGAEFWASKLYPEVQVTDVEGNWHYIIIHGRAIGAFPIAIALIVFGVLGVFGLAAFATVSVYANITEQQKIAVDRETAKIEATKELLDRGYEIGDVTTWLEGIKTPPPEAANIVDQFKTTLPALGIGTGAIILIVLAVIFLLGRR